FGLRAAKGGSAQHRSMRSVEVAYIQSCRWLRAIDAEVFAHETGGTYERIARARRNYYHRRARLSILREPGEHDDLAGGRKAGHPGNDVQRWRGLHSGERFGPIRLPVQKHRRVGADRRADRRGAVGLVAWVALVGHRGLLYWLGARLCIHDAG